MDRSLFMRLPGITTASFAALLASQGASAAGGACDYVIDGRKIGGFALVAFPAWWGVSGVMTPIVNHDGIVYQQT